MTDQLICVSGPIDEGLTRVYERPDGSTYTIKPTDRDRQTTRPVKVVRSMPKDTQRRALTIHASIPVIDSDPNVLGEHLREVTFVGEGYGCYSTFDVRPDAEDLGHEEAMEFFMGDTDPSEDWWGWPLDAEQYEGRRFRYQGLIIDCFWYWDGDGTLAFRITHPLLGLLRVIENYDCKKSHRWDDADLSGSQEVPDAD